MGAGKCLGQCILVFINIVFMVLSLVFLAIGAIVVGFVKAFGELLNVDIETAIRDILEEFVGSDAKADEFVEDFFAVFDGVGIALIVLGVFMFAVCMFGCSGACCSVKCLLIMYVVIVSLILVAQAAILGLYAGRVFDDRIKTELNNSLHNNYEGPNGRNFESVILNAVQAWGKCCGVESSTDFDAALRWNRTEGYRMGNVTYLVTLKIPVTCCKLVGDFPGDDIELQDNNCPESPTDINSWQNEGCFDKVEDNIMEYRNIVIGVVGGILGIELGCILLAIMLLCMLQPKYKY